MDEQTLFFRFKRHGIALLGVVIVVAALSAVYRYFAFNTLIEHETHANTALTQTLTNALWPRYADFVANAATIAPDKLPYTAEIYQLREDIIALLADLNLVDIKLHNADGLTLFVNDFQLIGFDKSSDSNFKRALSGLSVSALTFHDRLKVGKRTLFNRYILANYIPIHNQDGNQIDAVIHISSDVTHLVMELEDNQWLIVWSGLCSALLLYLLFFIHHAPRRPSHSCATQSSAGK